MSPPAKCTQEGEAEAAISGGDQNSTQEGNTISQQQTPHEKDESKELLLENKDAKEQDSSHTSCIAAERHTRAPRARPTTDTPTKDGQLSFPLGTKGAATTKPQLSFYPDSTKKSAAKAHVQSGFPLDSQTDPIDEIQPFPLTDFQQAGQPALGRQPHIERQPGAYLGAPGVHPQRLQDLSFALVGAIGIDENGQSAVPGPQLRENESEIIGGAFLVNGDEEAVVTNVVCANRDNLNDGEVIEGRALNANQALRPTVSNRRFFAAVASVLVVASVVVLLVVFLLLANDSTTSPMLPDDGRPTIYPPFQDGLRETLLNAIEDPSSHYHAANYWMLQDPNLDLYTPERQFQRFQMAFFYYFTNGDNWFRNDDWLSYKVSECDWYSSSPPSRRIETPICDGNGTMKVLNMTSNNLKGNFTGLTDYVSGVVYLDISNNQLSGVLPPIAGGLPTVEFIIANNSFSEFMVGAGGYSSHEIKVIRTDSNMFEGGSLPGFYYLLPKLEVFNNSGNNYHGPLDSSLASCKYLRSYSTTCDRVGTIPSEYGRLTTLEVFEIGGNSRMTGTIPSQLGLLTNLTLLDISGTGITGVIPTTLCRRESEGQLQIKANCSLVECCV